MVAGLIVLALSGCSDDDDPVPEPPQGSIAPTTDSPSRVHAVIYRAGKRLVTYDLASQGHKVIATLPTTDVAVSLDGTKYAVSEPADRGKENLLFLGDVDGGEKERLGRGRSPVFSPSSDSVAARVARNGYLICTDEVRIKDKLQERKPKGCIEGEQVVVYEIARGDEKPRVALGASRWSILGWTKDQGVVGASDLESYTAVGYAKAGKSETLGYLPSQVKAISPTEVRLLLVIDQNATLFNPLDGNGAGAPLSIPADRIDAARWAPNGEGVAVQVASARGSGPAHLVLMDSVTAETETVPESENVAGDVVWSTDAEWFAFVKGHGSRTQAVVCSVELDCHSTFSREGGVELLGLSVDVP